MAHCTDRSMPPANLAVAAEERGFESVFVTEHTHIPVRPFIRWRGGEAWQMNCRDLSFNGVPGWNAFNEG